MSKDIITNDFITEYLRDFTCRIYGIHMERTEELAAAFISRHGCDPDDAEVVTHFDQNAMTWTSHIERSKRGRNANPRSQGTVPGMPGAGERPIG